MLSQSTTEIQDTEPARRDRYILLYELFHSIASTLDPEETLELIVDAAVKITGANCATLSLVDWDTNTLEFKVSRGYVESPGAVKLKVGTGITGWVAKTGRALLVTDVSKDPRYFRLKTDVKSELAVPLKIDNRLIGVVNVESMLVNSFDVEDLEFLTLLAKQSAQVLRNSRLHDKLQRKVEELTSLIEISKTIAGTLTLEATLSHIVERATKLMDARLCTVRLLSEDGEELVLQALHGRSSEQYDHSNIRVANSLTGQAVLDERPLQVLDVKQEEKYLYHQFAADQQICALLSVPLKARSRIIGVLNINKATTYRFSDSEVKLVRTFADLCAIAIENARLYEEMLSLEEQARKAERLAVVGELSVGIAHEVRNPLTIIKMIFESDGKLTEKDLEVVGAEMRRMNKIISRFLDFAKPGEPVREACDSRKALRNALMLLSHATEKKNIKLRIEQPDDLPRVFADPVQLQQVYLNLLLNSIEALTDRGKIFVKLKGCPDGMVEFHLRDNGPGLDPEVEGNLFVPFTTTKPSGLGLGLSIVKRIVDSHNGELLIESSPKLGMKTTIRLPKAVAEIAPGIQPGLHR